MAIAKKVNIGHTFTRPTQLDFVHPTSESLIQFGVKMFASENLGQTWNDGEGWRNLEEGCTEEEWEGVQEEMIEWRKEIVASAPTFAPSANSTKSGARGNSLG